MVVGDIVEQDVEVIINSWNRNIIPWWLLFPQGVSRSIKKAAGTQPFKELQKMGSIPVGQARITSPGKLNHSAIIHVAGINMFWFATEYSVSQPVRNAMSIVNEQGFKSVAFPLIGSGSGNRRKEWSQEIIINVLKSINTNADVYIVNYR